MNRTLRSLLASTSVLTLCCIVSLGCESAPKKTADVSPGALALCTDCGQVKGTDGCCDPAAPRCTDCGLAKGSPGCCKIEMGSTETIALCAKCGHLKGTDVCCDPDNPVCDKCGLAEGSPGCCKIK